MKVTKSIILSAVAALIVAAGPEVSAPLIGVDNAAEAAVPAKGCKAGFVPITKSRTLKKGGKTITSTRCYKKGTQPALSCKAPKVKANKLVKQKGVLVAIDVCKKAPPVKKAKACKAGTVAKTKSVRITRAGAPATKTVVNCVAVKK